MNKVIFKLINDLLEADNFGKQNIATYNLTEGIEDYAKQLAIEELEDIASVNPKFTNSFLIKRIEQLKQN
jgi:hypothetical protein